MALATKPWDPAEFLDSDEAVAAYIDAALDDGDPALVAAALGDVARALGMSRIADETGCPSKTSPTEQELFTSAQISSSILRCSRGARASKDAPRRHGP